MNPLFQSKHMKNYKNMKLKEHGESDLTLMGIKVYYSGYKEDGGLDEDLFYA